MPRHLAFFVRVAVTLAGLAFILSQIDLGETINRLLRADLRWGLVAGLLAMSSLVLRAFRWRLLLRGLGIRLPFLRLVRLYFTGHFFNAFLPTGIGGDVVRIVEVTRYVPPEVAAGTVLLDRLTGLLMLFVLALAALPFRPEAFPVQQAMLVLVVALGGLLVGAVLLDGRLLRAAGRFLPAPLSPVGEGAVARLLRAVQAVGWPALRGALFVSLLFNLMQVSWWWAAARSIRIEMPFGYLMLVVPLLAISLLVPAVGGFGARESVATLLFDRAVVAAGMPPLAAGTGFALSTMVFLVERLSGLPGGPFYLWGSLRRQRAGQPGSRGPDSE